MELCNARGIETFHSRVLCAEVSQAQQKRAASTVLKSSLKTAQRAEIITTNSPQVHMPSKASNISLRSHMVRKINRLFRLLSYLPPVQLVATKRNLVHFKTKKKQRVSTLCLGKRNYFSSKPIKLYHIFNVENLQYRMDYFYSSFHEPDHHYNLVF